MRKPQRIDEKIPFKPKTIDDRIPAVIRAENVKNCVFSANANRSVIISGDNNILRNSTIYDPGIISIRGKNNILQNVRRVQRLR